MSFQFSKNELLNKVIWLIILLILTGGVYSFVQYRDYKNAPVVAVEGKHKIVEETPRYKIDITQPVVPNDDAIAEYIRSRVTSFKENALDQEGFLEGSSCTQYELGGTYRKVESQKLGTISYVYSMFEYTCGAHGNIGISTFTFNKDQQLIYIDQILDEQKFTNVSKKFGEELIIPKLKTQLGDMYNEEMVFHGLFDDDTDNEPFLEISPYFSNYITDDGITFIFEQYEVAPYAAGIPEVFVSWKELAPYLNSSFELRLKAANISILK